MRKSLFILCCISALAFTECSKEGNITKTSTKPSQQQQTSSDSYILYKGKKYELTKALYTNRSNGENENWCDIHVISKTVTYSTFLECLEGRGNGMNFHIYVPKDSLLLPVNSYNYHNTGGIPQPSRLGQVNVSLDCDFFMGSDSDSTVRDYMTNGTLKISKQGATYAIEYTGKDRDEQEVKCVYKGSAEKVKNF